MLLADGWTESEGLGVEFVRGGEGAEGEGEEWDLSSCAEVRGKYGLSSLMKQNKKAKICAVFCFAGKRKIFFIYL